MNNFKYIFQVSQSRFDELLSTFEGDKTEVDSLSDSSGTNDGPLIAPVASAGSSEAPGAPSTSEASPGAPASTESPPVIPPVNPPVPEEAPAVTASVPATVIPAVPVNPPEAPAAPTERKRSKDRHRNRSPKKAKYDFNLV